MLFIPPDLKRNTFYIQNEKTFMNEINAYSFKYITVEENGFHFLIFLDSTNRCVLRFNQFSTNNTSTKDMSWNRAEVGEMNMYLYSVYIYIYVFTRIRNQWEPTSFYSIYPSSCCARLTIFYTSEVQDGYKRQCSRDSWPQSCFAQRITV